MKVRNRGLKKENGLYSQAFEHDNCGIGAVVNIKGIQTHNTVEDALKILENLEHRAGKDAEGKTGDGAGILLQISHKFFSDAVRPLGIKLGRERDYGIGMFFFPQESRSKKQEMKIFETVVKEEGLEFLGWREVPVRPEILGKKAADAMPCILQAFLKRPENVSRGLEFDRRLYVVRRVFEQSSSNTYTVSLSSRTIVYKGMFLVDQLRLFFPDLQSEAYESAIATVHSRFSTNTNPSWERAHPNRLIVHNGEINTIRGNADKMLAREETAESECLRGALHKVLPVINPNGSDSSMLDNTLEFLMMSGMDLPMAMMILLPEPWENNRTMSQKKKDFYQYYATMMEPWDGPASILFSDGDLMGAVLDRNGLRPSRYYITEEDTLILSSEVGVLDLDPQKILVKERLKPGKMLLVDTVQGKVIDDETLKEQYASRKPYGEWVERHLIHLSSQKIPNKKTPELTEEECIRLQKSFGYTYEEVINSILPMAGTGTEAIGAMGADTPLAVLSKKNQPLFSYFKQLFAQVTNPPMDAIREAVVTSATVYIGKEGSLLKEEAENCRVLRVNHPILSNADLLKIKNRKEKGICVRELSILFYKNTGLEKAIEHMFLEADRAINEGVNTIILSDRGVDENHVAIPSLLAVSALNKHLVKTRKRTAAAIILESGEPREVHHFAVLLGYGASAVNPYLAQETIRHLIETKLLDKDFYAAVEDYNHAILHGMIKIASKMGISTLQSYQGAQIFEAAGLSEEVVEKYFTGTVSRIGGITLEDMEREIEELHSSAFDPRGLLEDLTLDSTGVHKMRSGEEEHLYNPKTIHFLQQAVRRGDYGLFQQYSSSLEQEDSLLHLRGLMDFRFPKNGIPIEEVESAETIVKRFKTGAMSYGSVSPEAHETMALAMNRIHGRSNSGEGGETSERLQSEGTEQNRCSAIKQVASGRFGVTSAYLVSAKEIQIKMAQGAKPGEGGHLPGKKVYPWIAKTRNSTAGVGLISPPPHHDIYSIEDMAQLIYDLKNANQAADISVKLVSEAGVGTVAAGVAKAGAQVILISGYDGGTGAAPKSSIYNAGLPWELGLAETHQTLIRNGLRNKVRLETDGKLMTGRDVAVAALLGAEEFGFATAPLVAMGCVMMRVCNLDTCPVGIATQNPELRKNFKGKPEHVINFMYFVAQELREYMARLGIRTVEELVGRTDLLKRKESLKGKAGKVDLSDILENPYISSERSVTFEPAQAFRFALEDTLDEKVLLKQLGTALREGRKRSIELEVGNTDRAFGTRFGSEITRRYGADGLEADTFTVRCRGAGGQSFGAFIPKGLTLELTGESNDYFGKGLSGGRLIVYPPAGVKFKQGENVITGNVALYGATSGEVYICGVAGERFCVRNSGARAVVEGVGEHGCEYMTGGRVVVLGAVGKNFAAGMSGGIAYVLDENSDLYQKLNPEMVSFEALSSEADILELKELLQAHAAYTNSEKGKEILANFDACLPKFKKVIPHDYQRMLKTIKQMEEKGFCREQAQVEAFYANTRGEGEL